MSNRLPDELYPIVDKIINYGNLENNENTYFKSLLEKYGNVLESDIKLFLDKVISYQDIPGEVRDKLLLYISGII